MRFIRLFLFTLFALFSSCTETTTGESSDKGGEGTETLLFLMKDTSKEKVSNISAQFRDHLEGKGVEVVRANIQRSRFQLVVKSIKGGPDPVHLSTVFANKNFEFHGISVNPPAQENSILFDVNSFTEYRVSHAPNIPRTFNHLSSILIKGEIDNNEWKAHLYFVEKEEELIGASRHPRENILYFDFPIEQMEGILTFLQSNREVSVEYKEQEDRSWGTLIGTTTTIGS